MAARREISQRKSALLENLRSAYREGQLVPGDMAPSVRDLARQYDLSVGVVAQQMQILVQEGLFHTVSGAGTFVGQQPAGEFQLYLFLLANSVWDNQIKAGFEEEIARRGCGTLVIQPHRALMHLESGTLPPVAGVFAYGARPLDELMARLNDGRSTPLPEVNYVERSEEFSDTDRVLFDNFDGGRQAAQHLLAAGHERVAYLGIHAENDFFENDWSVVRMEGWQAAMARTGLDTQSLVYLPERLASHAVLESPQLLQEAALKLLKNSGATAVVAANDAAAWQLIKSCQNLGLSSDRWPAIVSFDDTISNEAHILTSLRLPWEELGRTAANLLFERANGQLIGEPVCRYLPMRIISRLTCRGNWSLLESTFA